MSLYHFDIREFKLVWDILDAIRPDASLCIIGGGAMLLITTVALVFSIALALIDTNPASITWPIFFALLSIFFINRVQWGMVASNNFADDGAIERMEATNPYLKSFNDFNKTKPYGADLQITFARHRQCRFPLHSRSSAGESWKSRLNGRYGARPRLNGRNGEKF